MAIKVSYVVLSSIKREDECSEGHSHLRKLEQKKSQVSQFLYEQASLMILVA